MRRKKQVRMGNVQGLERIRQNGMSKKAFAFSSAADEKEWIAARRDEAENLYGQLERAADEIERLSGRIGRKKCMPKKWERLSDFGKSKKGVKLVVRLRRNVDSFLGKVGEHPIFQKEISGWMPGELKKAIPTDAVLSRPRTQLQLCQQAIEIRKTMVKLKGLRRRFLLRLRQIEASEHETLIAEKLDGVMESLRQRVK